MRFVVIGPNYTSRFLSEPHPLNGYESVPHFVILDVRVGSLDLHTYRMDGTLLDHLAISKPPSK